MSRSDNANGPTQDPSSRMGSRLARRLTIGLIGGCLIGLVIGAALGATFFEPGDLRFVMSTVGAVVAGTLLGGLWAGYSSLESPDPGHEPSATRRPMSDPELVREETGRPITGSPLEHEDPEPVDPSDG